MLILDDGLLLLPGQGLDLPLPAQSLRVISHRFLV